MNELNFAYWLQGYFELTDSNILTEEQVAVIKEHLSLVFTKKTKSTVRERAKAHGIDVTKGGNQSYIDSITGKRRYCEEPTKERSNEEKLNTLYSRLAVLEKTDPTGREFIAKTNELRNLKAEEAKVIVAKIKEELPINLDNSVIDSAGEVIAKYEKRQPCTDETHFDNFMDWDGLVFEVNELSFNARLTDQSGLVEEMITIGKDEVSEKDLTLLNKGAVFTLVVRREMIGDKVLRVSTIKFRPQHFWTKEEIDQIKVEASKYDSFFDLDDDEKSGPLTTVPC